ncbi:MAG TPA: M28 family peptidase [Verrucomicrobiae bacterium]|nr:M28 family peptidase [Verrucomicrobiae bacterium]
MKKICAIWLGTGVLSWASLLHAASADLAQALDTLQAADLMRHTRRLSSDEFEGRAPATPGEQLTVNYLVNQFAELGLKPGHPQGGYLQEVPLMGVTSEATVNIRAGGKTLDLALPADAIATTLRFQPRIQLTNTEMIFVGYGIVAPEYRWDDFKDADVHGKTIVMLVNDPPIPDPTDPAKLDDKMFKGRAMTYYGRWTYKYEIAAKKGAAAALIVHETGPAGYPYFVLVASNTRENFDLQSTSGNDGTVPVQGWLTETTARELFTRAGYQFEQLKQSALRRDFKPVRLDARASFDLKNRLRPVTSRNVIAKVEGSDPKLRDEYVIYTAHWDHLGRNEKLAGDQIFNGALDNAIGTAGLLELAEAFARLKTPPRRSVLFLAVTAEEKGLLGAKYYVEHPIYPLERTVANLNMDGLNPWGRTRDVEVIGIGNSTLEDLLQSAATAQGRVIAPDSSPEKGRFYRSDHFEFAKVGVPALYLKGGIEFPGQPPGFGKKKLDEYTDQDYHKVSDEIKPDWDLAGAVEDLRLLFEVGWQAAQADRWPEWRKGSEFKARRDAMLHKASTP